jgi:hypothetical protein
MARALEAKPGAEGAQALGRTSRRLGAALVLLAALAFAAAGPAAMAKLADWSGGAWALIAGALYLAAGGVGATLLMRGRPRRALIIAGALAVTAHAVLAAALAPSLRPLWLSSRAATRSRAWSSSWARIPNLATVRTRRRR